MCPYLKLFIYREVLLKINGFVGNKKNIYEGGFTNYLQTSKVNLDLEPFDSEKF